MYGFDAANLPAYPTVGQGQVRMFYLVDQMPEMNRIYLFADIATASTWDAIVNHIKDSAKAINRAHPHQNSLTRSQIAIIWDGWLKVVERLRADYGSDMVPLDIRAAFDNVKVNGCGLETVVW